uniref:Ovule protein n=1 Tax=Schistosoma mansoni TaxID=6183 RepID=A0A5K4F8Q5_SCHMA
MHLYHIFKSVCFAYFVLNPSSTSHTIYHLFAIFIVLFAAAFTSTVFLNHFLCMLQPYIRLLDTAFHHILKVCVFCLFRF